MRSSIFIAVAAVVALLLAGASATAFYDAGRDDRIADGVRIAGVDVGGLHREQARALLGQQLLDPLNRPVVVRHDERRFRLTAKEARITANLGGMVDEAVRRSRTGNPISRTLRDLTGRRVDAEVEPQVSYSREAVGRLIRRVERRVERSARDAAVSFSAAGLSKVEGRDGFRLHKQRLRRDVEEAILAPVEEARTVRPKVERYAPKVRTAELAKKYPTAITVDRAGKTLRLFKNLQLVKSYPIAVGKAGLETPAGLYGIENKQVNPYWHVPNSDWAGELAGRVIPPGPENPLKARWMGIYAGAGIHGTADRGSIGTNASHGCIRMLVEDVIELYDRVQIGTPVYIA